MGIKALIFIVVLMVLVSACSIEKTKPIVTDVDGEIKEESKATGDVVKEVEEDKTKEISEKVEEDKAGEGEVKEELPPGTHVVTIKDLKLDPMELTIKKGDTVVWKHEDEWEEDEETRHYLAAHTNEFRSPMLYFGDEFEHTFNKIGTFTYIDIVYKERDYMRGKIVVE